MDTALSSSSTRQRIAIAADITSQLPPGTFNLSIDQFALLVNCHPAHIRNQLSKGAFPVATICIGRRRLITLTAAVDYLTSLAVAASNGATRHSKPLGRPTKASKRMGMGVQS